MKISQKVWGGATFLTRTAKRSCLSYLRIDEIHTVYTTENYCTAFPELSNVIRSTSSDTSGELRRLLQRSTHKLSTATRRESAVRFG